jgi:predicted permease
MLHWQDVRYAFRLLRRSPGFALLTVLVLAGVLGLSTFTFSFLYTAMVRPLPLGEGDRIVRLTQLEGRRRTTVDVVDLAALRASMGTVRDLGGYTKREVILGREGDRRVLTATSTEPNLFAVARTPAFLGRTLLRSDAQPGAEPVIVLAYRTWQAAFGEDRSIVDSHVAVNGTSTRVVGVMPDGFGFPVTQDAWLPMPSTVTTSTLAGREYVSVFARLAEGATQTQAAAEATAILRRAIADRDTSARAAAQAAFAVESYPAAQIGDERTIVFTGTNLVAGLILLLALVNVTTLLAARAHERVRETAIRLALGAPTRRLVMQGMWETIILCTAGGIVGTIGVGWGLETITTWTQANMPGSMAFWWVWRLDRVTLLSAGAFVTVAIGVLGSVVSRHATRTNVRAVMQDGTPGSGARRDGRLTRALVATQVAVVTVLMFVGVLSGVMTRRMIGIDPGYDATNLIQAYVTPSVERFATRDARAKVFRGVQTQLDAQSEVAAAMLRTTLTKKGSESSRFVLREHVGATQPPTANIVGTFGSLSTLDIHLVQGRSLIDADDLTRPLVVLVSQSVATRHWPNRSAVGEQLQLPGVGDTLQWRTVVGVVSDIPYGDLLSRDRSADAIYIPLLQADAPSANVFVRYRSNEIAGRQALNQAFGAVDPLLVPDGVYRASEVIAKSTLVATGLTKLFGGCFAFALLLAVAGTYGLMSRSIGLRTREIGVRRAIGASDAVVTQLLLRQGARQVGIGTLIAAPALVMAGAAATYFLPLGGVATTVTGMAVSSTILLVVLGATWLPTRRVVAVPLRDALWRS